MTRRLVAAAITVALSACSGIGSGGTRTSTDHWVSLAEHESADLASQLVELPGYSYADVPADELTEILGRFHGPDGNFTEAIWAASFHGVVYRWIRHGVEAHFDGADGTSMERWLELYLTAPAPSPAETPGLEDLLVPIDGFTYANAPNLDALERAVGEAFGDVAHSIHKLADDGGSVGSLTLVDPTVEMSLDDAVTAFAEASGTGIDPRDLTVIEGVPVASHDEQGVIFQMWVTDGVVAILAVETAEPEAITAQLLRGWEQLDTAV